MKCEMRGDIAVLTLDRPPANALVPSMREALKAALCRAFDDADVGGVVLCGAGAGFSSGVDIGEYDGPLARPWVADLCDLVEMAPKPVVAALHGMVLGAGFELALAAHARVARAGTRVALPEVGLGLVPGGGATQRAPRLAGAQAALELMLSGQPADVAGERTRRFVDLIVDSDPLAAAVDMAATLARSGKWERTRDRMRGLSDPAGYSKALSRVAESLDTAHGAAADILRCVEAAQLLPFARGLDFERTLFEERLASDSARALRHIFAAERRAAAMPETAQGVAPPVRDVVLLGSGAVLPELAVALLDGGLKVQLALPDGAMAQAVTARVRQIYDAAVGRGRLTGPARDARLSRLGARDDYAALREADVVLDSGGAIMGGEMPSLKQGAVWASLDSDGGGAICCRIQRPAHTGRLVEICVAGTSPVPGVAALARMFADLGRTVVRCGGGAGSAGDAMAGALYRAALALVAEAGFNPYAVDAAAREAGFARGPFEMMDAEGLDTVRRRIARMEGTAPPNRLLDERLTAGATGRAAGRGFYEHGPGRSRPVPALADRGWRPDDTVARIGAWPALHAALTNAAARLVAARAVLRAADLDVVMVMGYGFARDRGGPLFQADLRGLLSVMKDMRVLAPLASDVWTPAPLIEDMVKNGEGFFGRSRAPGASA